MTGDAVWIAAALAAALAQTLRNAAQATLTGSLGTIGATHVRFLYGLPFGLVMLAAAAIHAGGLPAPTPAFLLWTALGAAAQITATALMLAAMRERAFIVVTVYTRTELIQTALLGAILLGDGGPWLAIGVMLASLGVVIASWPAGRTQASAFLAWQPAAMGLFAGALFGLAAVAYRGAVLALGEDDLAVRAGLTLAVALALQAGTMALWFAVTDRARLSAIARAWRPSLGAGFAGALASLLWFVAFAMTSAANVKLVGLAEILFAGIVSRRYFREGLSRRELVGAVLIVIGAIAALTGDQP